MHSELQCVLLHVQASPRAFLRMTLQQTTLGGLNNETVLCDTRMLCFPERSIRAVLHAYAGNATPFPEDDLADYPGGLNNETVLANSRAWCQARSSGEQFHNGSLHTPIRLEEAAARLSRCLCITYGS
jgi:hypothetical protein